MDSGQAPRTKQETIAAFESMITEAFEALFEIPPQEAEDEINHLVSEEGYDPGRLAARMQALADEALRTSPLDWRTRAKTAREDSRARSDAVRARLPQGRDALLALAQQLLGQAPAPMAAHFRNLESSMSDEDLASFVCNLVCLAEDEEDRGDRSVPS